MMLKYAALISLLVVMGEGQRPPYAGSANRYPVVLPRFAEEEAAASAAIAAANAAAAAQAGVAQGVNGSVGNRVGEENTGTIGSQSPAAGAQNPIPSVAAAPLPSTTSTTSELPVLALGQAEYVDRIKTWPEETRPFWYTNREHIAAHLNPGNQPAVLRPNVETRSFFGGK